MRVTMARTTTRATRMYEDTMGTTRAGGIFGGCLIGDDAASETGGATIAIDKGAMIG